MQIAARPFGEETALRVALAVERAAGPVGMPDLQTATRKMKS